MKRKSLGCKLEQLLNNVPKQPIDGKEVAFSSSLTDDNNSLVTPLQKLAICDIHPGSYQPRQLFNEDSLKELATSIKSQGVIQPIIVRVSVNGYEIIAGERRFRAAKLAGFKTIPVIIRTISDQEALAFSIIENIQRDDLNIIEQAKALHRLMIEFNLTHEQIAKVLGYSRSSVTNILRLLKLAPAVIELLLADKIDQGHGKLLLVLDHHQQLELAHLIIKEQLSVKKTAKLVKKYQQPSQPKSVALVADPDVLRLQRELSDILGAKLAITNSSNGKGKIVIYYHDYDELEGILAHIR